MPGRRSFAVVSAMLGAFAGPACTSLVHGHEGPDAGEALDGGAPLDGSHAPADAPSQPPDFDSIPWTTVGYGVTFKDSENPAGDDVFVGYAGYGVTEAEAQAWITALYDANLEDRGVRYVYAVQGPDDVEYTNKEIQNTHLIANLLPEISSSTHFIAVAGHSSGGWVACELLQQLYDEGLDPDGKTSGRTVYYDLDGVESCLDTTIMSHLRNAYFVSAHTDVGSGGYSLNATAMMMGAMMFGKPFLLYDASQSGCDPTADLCLHVSLINTKPQDPTTGTPDDYAACSASRPVNHWYLDDTASELPE